jgi:hypothetical protein
MKNSFHAHFTKTGLVSHFLGIPLKREMTGGFERHLPVKSLEFP